jgi:hypothetical protein
VPLSDVITWLPQITFAQQAIKDENRLADIRQQLGALSAAHDTSGVRLNG